MTELVDVAAEAYVYGYPLIRNLEEIEKASAGTGVVPLDG